MSWKVLEIDERRAGLIVLGFMAGVSVLAALTAPLIGLDTVMIIGALAGSVIFGGLFWAYWLGQRWVNIVTVLLTTVLTAVVIIVDDGTRQHFSPAFFVPPVVVAHIFLGWPGILASGALMMAIVIPGLGLENDTYTNPLRVIMVIVVLVGTVMGQLVSDTNARRAEQRAEEAQKQWERAEQATLAVEERAKELELRNAEQSRLLDLVAELEVPIISIAEGVLLAPLVGSIDTSRAKRISEALLKEVSHQRTKFIILDLAGISVIDTHVTKTLLKIIQALQLLGCKVILSSISATMAANITALGVDMRGMITTRSPQEALEDHISRTRPVYTN